MTARAPALPLSIPLDGGCMTGWSIGATDRPPDLVWLHATGFNAGTYRPLLERLGPRWHVVALDLRGHGRTTLPADPARMLDWQTYAQDVRAALQWLVPAGPQVPVLAGHSMGATVALLVADQAPGLCRQLLLCDPAMFPQRLALVAQLPGIQRLLIRSVPIARNAARRRSDFASHDAAVAAYRDRATFRRWAPGFLEAYVADAFRAVPTGGVTLRCRPDWEAATFAALRHRPWSALRRVQVPVDILAAEHGSTIGYALRSMHRRAPRARLQLVPGGGHLFPMEQPDTVATALERMLAAQA